jgi:hypothetical protein
MFADLAQVPYLFLSLFKSAICQTNVKQFFRPQSVRKNEAQDTTLMNITEDLTLAIH